ncbi:MAG: HNH endonuclease [Hormoscilla sp. GM7CHS1pb]|nr:HNH endonuclease [Hormoscilla sp. GM7CHS1pb]
MDRNAYQPTYAGTPQGGVISPLLANIALHGMETEIRKIVPASIVKQRELGVVRYADDFVVMHKDQEVVEQAKEVTSKWLEEIGVELKPEKTSMAHTLKGTEPGFDFLGFNIRQYKVGKYRSGKTGKDFKTLIKPSNKAIKTHKEKLKDVVDRHKAAPQAALISRLNPIIRGWCNYNRTVVSKEIFGELDKYLWEITWKWAKRRHPNKNDRWVFKKYWKAEGSRQWNFMDTKGANLIQHSETEIVRHIKVKGTASPMDGNLVYWSKRLRKSPDVSNRVLKLLNKQKGKCGKCGILFKDGDKWEVDHIVPKSLGGKDRYDNLQLLHDYCHHQKTRTDGSQKGRTRKGIGIIEEPDEVKISRPVLKTSRTGDSLA